MTGTLTRPLGELRFESGVPGGSNWKRWKNYLWLNHDRLWLRLREIPPIAIRRQSLYLVFTEYCLLDSSLIVAFFLKISESSSILPLSRIHRDVICYKVYLLRICNLLRCDSPPRNDVLFTDREVRFLFAASAAEWRQKRINIRSCNLNSNLLPLVSSIDSSVRIIR